MILDKEGGGCVPINSRVVRISARYWDGPSSSPTLVAESACASGNHRVRTGLGVSPTDTAARPLRAAQVDCQPLESGRSSSNPLLLARIAYTGLIFHAFAPCIRTFYPFRWFGSGGDRLGVPAPAIEPGFEITNWPLSN